MAFGFPSFDFVSEGDDLFGGGGVDTYGAIELFFCGAALEGDGEALHHLGSVGTDDVAAQDPVTFGVYEELDGRLLVAAREGMFERSKL